MRAAPRLTAGGARQLQGGSLQRGGVVTQLLGVFRYMADPELRRRLAPLECDHDAFDVLLSDGANKVKCVLAPEAHQLIWTGDIAAYDIVLVETVEVLGNDGEEYPICVVKELQPISNDRNRPDAAIRLNEVEKLEFIEAQHPRQVDLLPLVGGREYYLPLRSDTFSLDWECSFSGGIQEEESPLDELEKWNGSEKNVASRQWGKGNEYCTSILMNRRILSLEEVVAAAPDQYGSSLPMTGTVRVKSRITHVGNPKIPSAFPFVFHIVLVDCSSAVEVAFYGDMCAQYFLCLQEGDLVQLEGYKIAQPGDLVSEYSGSSLVLYYEHQSTGRVRHVPEKYWRLLVATKSLPWPASADAFKYFSNSVNEDSRSLNGVSEITKNEQNGVSENVTMEPACWLECSYITTQGTQNFSDQERNAKDQFYFEVVGVLSYVGKIYRKRKRNADDASYPGITEYRWVKLIDASSSLELTIEMEECSQPAVFRSLEAGNSIMMTKLQWAIDNFGEENGIEYAKTSSFSIFRVNEDIVPFLAKDECRINSFFAKERRPSVVKTRQQEESALRDEILSMYRPQNSFPSTAAGFMEAFGIATMNFSGLHELSNNIQLREHRHVGLIGSVVSVSGAPGARYRTRGYLSLQDRVDKESELTVRVDTNQLFQPIQLSEKTKELIPYESLPLISALSPELFENLSCSVTRAVAPALGIEAQPLTLEIIQAWMLRDEVNFFFSLHVFRDAKGRLDWSIDAILPAP